MRGQRSATARLRRKGRRRNFSSQQSRPNFSSIDDYLASISNQASVGDPHKAPRKPGVTRVAYHNIQGLDESLIDPKQRDLERWIKEEKLGIIMLGETNRYWARMPEGTSWKERMRNASQHGYYSIDGNNVHKKRRDTSSF